MAEPNRVEIIEVCSVAAEAVDDNSAPNSLPLTFFDLRWVRLLTFDLLYFYKLSAPEEFFHTNIIPRLKHSLSLALGHRFLPIAGTLTWPPNSPKPVLTYAPGDAVSLTVARSHTDFALLTGIDNVVCDASAYHPLVPDLSRDRSPVLRIQLTVFPNHGFSIGITVNHVVLDGTSAIMFVKAWAHICRSLVGVEGNDHDHDKQQSRSLLPSSLEPFYDRSLIKDPANLEAIFSNQLLNSEGPNNRSLLSPLTRQVPPNISRGTFQLPLEKLEKLKRFVKLKNKNHDPIHVSTFSITCAYAWICLVRAEEIKDNKIYLGFPVNCRSRLDPPLPHTYFGTCVVTGFAVAERELLLGKEGLFVAVKAISEGMRKLDMKVLDGAENWVSGLKLDGQVCHISSSHRFGYYETDFGWGRPTKVDAVSIYKPGFINLFDRRNGDGGVQIGLVLKKHHLEAFASLFVEGLESLELDLKDVSRIHHRL